MRPLDPQGVKRWHVLSVGGQLVRVQVCQRRGGWSARTAGVHAAFGVDEQDALANLIDLLVLCSPRSTST